jgi:hypothetical protein
MRSTRLSLASVLLLTTLPAPAAPEEAPPKPAVKAPDKAGGAAPAQAEPVPTVEDVRKLLEAGNGSDALRQINRLLALRGKAAEAYDRYELLTLKGDAHLRLRANEAAAVAFKQAAGETDDKVKEAIARATEQLIRRSKGLAYTPKKAPKGQAAGPIDVVDPESRHKALAALFVDEMAPVLPKVEAAKDAKTVAPMLAAMAAAREMEYLELAANGSADQINGMVEGLKEQGKTMLGKVLEKGAKRVDRITQRANETENVKQIIPNSRGGYRTVQVPKRRGVDRDDVTELKTIVDGCDELMAQARALAAATGGDEEEVEDLLDGADDLKVHVQRMLRVHDVNYEGRREADGRDS